MKKIIHTMLSLVTIIGASFAMQTAQAQDIDIMERILQRGELRVGIQTQGEPVSFINKHGERAGLAIDIAKMMADDLNVKLTLHDYDWKGLIPALLTDRFDILAADMTPTAQRTTQVLFSKPLFYQDTVAFVRQDSPYQRWDELNKQGLNIGGTQGGTYITTIKTFLPQATIKEYASGPASAQAVASGRIDGAVSSLSNVNAYASSFNNLRALEGIIEREPLGFATRKENIHLKFWMDNYIELNTANRKLDKLIDYWWLSDAWEKDHK